MNFPSEQRHFFSFAVAPSARGTYARRPFSDADAGVVGVGSAHDAVAGQPVFRQLRRVDDGRPHRDDATSPVRLGRSDRRSPVYLRFDRGLVKGRGNNAAPVHRLRSEHSPQCRGKPIQPFLCRLHVRNLQLAAPLFAHCTSRPTLTPLPILGARWIVCLSLVHPSYGSCPLPTTLEAATSPSTEICACTVAHAVRAASDAL